MRKAITALMAALLLVVAFTAYPASAKKPGPIPGNCSYAKGKTTCVDTLVTTQDGPLNGTTCNGGTYQQTTTVTTTTTTVYKGRGVGGPVLKVTKTTDSVDGPATCVPRSAPGLAFTPNGVGCDPGALCYSLAGSGLLADSFVNVDLIEDHDLDPNTPPTLRTMSFGPADGDGVFAPVAMTIECSPIATLSMQAFGTDPFGSDVESNTVVPCSL